MVKQLIRVALLFGIAISGALLAVAQDCRTLTAQLDRLRQEREPAWTVARKGVVDANYASVHLKAGKERIGIMIMILRSAEEATECFKSWNNEISDPELQTPIEANRLKGSIAELGDQNYLWSCPSHTAATILFRQRNAFVMVIGTSENAAQRFALLVAEQLAAR